MGLSVKALENMLREEKETATSASETAPKAESSNNKTTHVRSLEEELQKRLATPVEIRVQGKDRGQILIRFESNDDFMRIVESLANKPRRRVRYSEPRGWIQ